MMPVTFVKEHGMMDSGGKRGWGKPAVVSQALRAPGAEWLADHGRRLAVPVTPGDEPPRHQAAGCAGGKARAAQLLPTGCFPATRPVELPTLVFEQACRRIGV